ncbi:MAG: roadblock/LC7 domain-containing protein [Methermicoccaceae archaeon]
MGGYEYIHTLVDRLVEKGASMALVATRDGLMLASSPYKGFREEVLSAMCAAMLASAETAMAKSSSSGGPSKVIVVSDKSVLLVKGAGTIGLIAVLLQNEPATNLSPKFEEYMDGELRELDELLTSNISKE